MRMITAKYNGGKCSRCGKTLNRGALIGYEQKKAYCSKCAEIGDGTTVKEVYPNVDMMYEDQCARMCGL